MGNGVGPMKDAFVSRLVELGWDSQQPFPLETVEGGARFGKLDLGKPTSEGVLGVEWETGNISSSHRSMNKMSLGLRYGVLLAGVLIVPTKALAQYLTDRIGNLYELLGYIRLWESIPVEKGYLGIFAVEHDQTSTSVPRILKGTDGRALR
jgi:Restriction endonuclease BamHI